MKRITLQFRTVPPCVLRSILVIALFAPAFAKAAGTSVSAPDHVVQVMLIKNALTAVNHGNITGNFTVLRDLGSPRFRQQHTATDLGKLFASLRDASLDLSPILVTDPVLTQPAVLDEFRGRLRLVGYCPTRPQMVRFVLDFQHTPGGWSIDEIALLLADNEDNHPGPRRVPALQDHASQQVPSHRESQIPRPTRRTR